MRVLVTYGSKMGGTEGLAVMVADVLSERGCDVDVWPAASMCCLTPYDAVIVGGALYAGRWHRDARRFVKANRHELQERPVWLFSSGPLDTSATTTEIEPVRQVAKLMQSIGARGHMTFGGRLDADAPGFVARSMAKSLSGDWRDHDQVRRWATEIADQLAIPVAA